MLKRKSGKWRWAKHKWPVGNHKKSNICVIQISEEGERGKHTHKCGGKGRNNGWFSEIFIKLETIEPKKLEKLQA